MAIFNSRNQSRRGAAARAMRCLHRWKAALLLVGWCGLACAATEGQPAPAMQAKLLDGTPFNLADSAGKVVIVNMWATWCAPCREEMPALDAYYRQHRDQGLVLIALSMDDPKDDAKVRAATKTYSFPVGLANDADMKGLRAHLAPASNLRRRPKRHSAQGSMVWRPRTSTRSCSSKPSPHCCAHLDALNASQVRNQDTDAVKRD